jgi:parallel beta-helix repeat protein
MNRTRTLTASIVTALISVTLAVIPASAAPAVYLDEPFSDSPTTWNQDWFDADIGGRNRVSAISDGTDGPAIKVSIPAGSHFGSAMHWEFADQGITEPDELYYRYYLRVPSGPEHRDRGKLPGPAGLYSGSARNNIKPTDSAPGWSARMFFSPTYDGRDPDHTQLGFYVYHRDQASNNGDLLLWDTQTGTLRNDAWYCIEGHVDMNTPGQANGLLEGWVDEQLAFYQDDFKFRGSSDGGIDVKSFWFDVYYGGTGTAPYNYSFDFDSLVLSSDRIGCGDNPVGGFRDTGESIHEANIEKLAHAEITKGCNPPLNDLYCPDTSVTRGQMAAFLVRAMGIPGSATDFFTDDDSTVFEANINALAASGITRGCGGDNFCPNRSVTRGEMAAFLDRALKLPATTPDWFDDDDTSIFEGAIDRLAASGITSGCNPPANNNFCPHKNVTRGQMASFLSRALTLPAPPPPPPGYTPPPVPAGFDAVVPVGWSIQEVADSQPTGARIYIEAGTHYRQTVVPKGGQQFVGEPGAVMDGVGVTGYAFTGSANNVTISGLEIKNYTSGTDKGAIHASGSGWLIDDCNVHHNEWVGVSIRGGSTISNSTIVYNDSHGVFVDGGSGATVEDNEIAFNNIDQPPSSTTVENAAGAKFHATTNLTVRSNYVHDNRGRGLWTHQDNVGTLYDGNTINDNWWAGIFHDRSGTMVVTDNAISGNGLKADSSDKFYHGAVQITGPDASVTNNTINGNHNAVVVIGYNLPIDPDGTVITGNTITNSGNTGIVTNSSDRSVFDTATIDGNEYLYNNTAGSYWVWNHGPLYDWAKWQEFGNDSNGSLAGN